MTEFLEPGSGMTEFNQDAADFIEELMVNSERLKRDYKLAELIILNPTTLQRVKSKTKKLFYKLKGVQLEITELG